MTHLDLLGLTAATWLHFERYSAAAVIVIRLTTMLGWGKAHTCYEIGYRPR